MDMVVLVFTTARMPLDVDGPDRTRTAVPRMVPVPEAEEDELPDEDDELPDAPRLR